MSVPVNVHHWDDISFLHWPVEPSSVARLIPAGLEVLTVDGSAWVGVTPFSIRVRPFGIPFVLPGFAFPETNVRTYVVGPDGTQGIWFLHMEVPAAWFVATLRVIGLPYTRREMSIDRTGGAIRYRSRSTGGSTGGHDIVVRPGPALDPPWGGPVERFLTARWHAYHRLGPMLLRTPVEHQPWQLSGATAEVCDVGDLLRAGGLAIPDGPPLVHHSPGVVVRVGRPSIVRFRSS